MWFYKIGDYALLPDDTDYYEASLEWVQLDK